MKNLKKNKLQKPEQNNNPLSIWRGGSLFKTARLVFCLTIVFLSLAGCVYKPFHPSPSSEYTVESRYAIVTSDSLSVILRPQGYSGESQSIGSDFFSMFLRVKNTSSRPIRLDGSSFNILSGNIQYDHVPLQVVLGTLQTQYITESFNDPFQDLQTATLTDNTETVRNQYLDIVNNYFSFGEVLPGGIKEGYLFYNERIERMELFEIDVLGTKVLFSRSDR